MDEEIAVVRIVPDASNFRSELLAEIEPAAADAGATLESELRDGITGAESALSGLGEGAFTTLESEAATAASDIQTELDGVTVSGLEGELNGVSFSGLESEAAGAFSSLESDASSAFNDIEGGAATAGDTITREITDGTDTAGGGFDGLLTKGLSAASGLVAGFAIGDLIAQGLDLSAAQTNLEIELGVTGELADAYGRVAGDLYSAGWGDGIDDVNTALQSVVTNLGELDEIGGDKLEDLTGKALALSQVFDVDTRLAIRAVGSLLDTDMVASADEGFDAITVGLRGVDSTLREELLESLIEYGGNFETLGLDGAAAIGTLVKASQDGAFNVDVVADSFRELSLAITENAGPGQQALEDLGLSVDGVLAAISQGGQPAEEALADILEALREVEDPEERNRLTTALLGTPWESFSQAALASLNPVESKLQDVEGAAEDLRDRAAEAQPPWETFGRNLAQATTPVADFLNFLLDGSQSIDAMTRSLTDLNQVDVNEFIESTAGLPATILDLVGGVEGLNDQFPDLALEIKGVASASAAAGGPVGAFASTMGDLGDEAEITEDDLRGVITAAQELVDPVFAARNATERAADAQAELNRAADEYGEGSPEYVTAAQDVASAELELESALLRARDSGDDVLDVFDRLVDEGKLPVEAANALRDSYAEIRDQGDLLEESLRETVVPALEGASGDYEASFEAILDGASVGTVGEKLAALAKKRFVDIIPRIADAAIGGIIGAGGPSTPSPSTNLTVNVTANTPEGGAAAADSFLAVLAQNRIAL